MSWAWLGRSRAWRRERDCAKEGQDGLSRRSSRLPSLTRRSRAPLSLWKSSGPKRRGGASLASVLGVWSPPSGDRLSLFAAEAFVGAIDRHTMRTETTVTPPSLALVARRVVERPFHAARRRVRAPGGAGLVVVRGDDPGVGGPQRWALHGGGPVAGDLGRGRDGPVGSRRVLGVRVASGAVLLGRARALGHLLAREVRDDRPALAAQARDESGNGPARRREARSRPNDARVARPRLVSPLEVVPGRSFGHLSLVGTSHTRRGGRRNDRVCRPRAKRSAVEERVHLGSGTTVVRNVSRLSLAHLRVQEVPGGHQKLQRVSSESLSERASPRSPEGADHLSARASRRVS